MKKFTVLLSVLLISCMTVTSAFADAELKADNIEIDSDSITVPVVLSEMPDDISDLSAVTVRFTYDNTKMTFDSIEGVALANNINVNKGNIIWYDDSSDGSGKLSAESLNAKNGVLFNLKFTKISGAAGTANIDINFVELADSKINISKSVKVINANVDFGNDEGTGEDSEEGSGEGSGNGSGTGSGTGSEKPSKNDSKKDDSSSSNSSNGNNVSSGSSSDDSKEEINDDNTSEITISDIASNHWAYTAATELVKKGIISGDDTDGALVLRPNDDITREEAAKMALIAKGIKPESGLELTFEDSANISDWAKDYIATAVKYNVISGYSDNTVRSKNTITREEMITMLIKAFNWGTSDDELTFADNDKITWSKPYLAQAIALGILKGYDDNTIRPDANITRAESFALLARCIKLNDALMQ